MRRVKITVSGRVQGVYFRAFTQNKAKQLGVKGSVQNLPDGCVEIIAEAEEGGLGQFIQWCHKGPVTARVDQVKLADIPIDAALTVFEIIK